MVYTVVWMKGERVIGTTPFPTFSNARNHAEEHFPAKQNQLGVDRVEVRDDDKMLVFHHPRTLGQS